MICTPPGGVVGNRVLPVGWVPPIDDVPKPVANVLVKVPVDETTVVSVVFSVELGTHVKSGKVLPMLGRGC